MAFMPLLEQLKSKMKMGKVTCTLVWKSLCVPKMSFNAEKKNPSSKLVNIWEQFASRLAAVLESSGTF